MTKGSALIWPVLMLALAMSACARVGTDNLTPVAPTTPTATSTAAPSTTALSTTALSTTALSTAATSTLAAPPSLTPTPIVTPRLAASPVVTPAARVPVTATASAQRSAALMPAVVAEVNLGVRFEPQTPHAIALDAPGGRLFISAPPDKTLIVSLDDWKIVDTLPVAGGLAVDAKSERLYIGGRSGVSVYDLNGLQTIGVISVTAASLGGSSPIADESTGAVYVVSGGVYVVPSGSLQASGSISGTFPSTNSLAYAVDAALDARNRLLYISLNNSIPGSNNGNTLAVYDLRGNKFVYQDGERSITSLVADESTGRAYVARRRMDTFSLGVFDGGRQLQRINGVSGSVQVDAKHQRLYLAEAWGQGGRLVVMDARTLALLSTVPLARPYTLAALDADQDQLYLLSPDGYLLVMQGHGAEATEPADLAPTRITTRTTMWAVPSPNFARDRILFGAWAGQGAIAGGPWGPLSGQLMMSADAGMTWARSEPLSAPQSAGTLAVSTLTLSPDFARDQTVFASFVTPNGSGGGLYVSSDGGRSWQPGTAGLDDWLVTQLVAAPGYPVLKTVFAQTMTGLFRSTDGGMTWQRTAFRMSAPLLSTRTLAASPDYINDKTVIASSNEGALISRDGGETWWPLVNSRATTLAFSPAYVRDKTLWGSFVEGGVLRSEDGGATWLAAARGLRLDAGANVTLVLSPNLPQDKTVFALMRSSERTALYRSTDNGASWQLESSGLLNAARVPTLVPSPDFARDGVLFIGTGDGPLRAIKLSDLKWSSAPASLDRLNVETIAVSPDYPQDHTVFIGSARAGVFVSGDGGKTWRETNFPARDTGLGKLVLALSPDYSRDRAVFASAGGQTFRSDDGGANWHPLAGLGSYFPAGALALSPQFASDLTLLVGGGSRAPRLLRSADGGQTWNAASGLAQNYGILTLAFAPGASRIAYAWADQAGLYRSSDNGGTWTRVFSPTAAVTSTSWIAQACALSPDFLRDRLMFAGFVGPQNFRRSADGGASWHPSGEGLPANLIWGSALAVAPEGASRDRQIFLGTDKGVFRSQDGGATWKAANNGLPQVGVLALALSPSFASDRTVFAGLVERGLYLSTDGGANWRPAR